MFTGTHVTIDLRLNFVASMNLYLNTYYKINEYYFFRITKFLTKQKYHLILNLIQIKIEE